GQDVGGGVQQAHGLAGRGRVALRLADVCATFARVASGFRLRLLGRLRNLGRPGGRVGQTFPQALAALDADGLAGFLADTFPAATGVLANELHRYQIVGDLHQVRRTDL